MLDNNNSNGLSGLYIFFWKIRTALYLLKWRVKGVAAETVLTPIKNQQWI